MFKRILVTLLVFAMSVSQSFAKAPPPGTGFLDVPTNVLLVLGVNASMNADIFSGSARYPNNTVFEIEKISDSTANDDFFVAKYSDNNIEKFNSAGEYQMDWGEYGSGDSEFDTIFDIDYYDGYLYASDKGNGRVQKFTNMGVHTLNIAITATSETRGLVVNGNGLHVLNGNGTVEVFNSTTGAHITTWANTGGYMLADDSAGNIYVTNYSGKKVEKYNSAGTLLLSFDSKPSAGAKYNPYGIEVNGAGTKIFVSDNNGKKVYEYDGTGTYVAVYSPTGSGKFREPRGLTMDDTEKVWATDYSDSEVKDLTGTALFSIASHETRMDQAKRVIKDLVTNSDLTEGANFGLITFSTSATLEVPISSTGASDIYAMIDSVTASGSKSDMDDAMTLAESYLLGSSSPMTAGAWCQDDLIVVINDGGFVDTTSSTTAANLYTNYDVKTFPVGFLISESSASTTNYINLATAGGTYPDGPVFASNWQQLYASVTDYILSVINSNLTFSAPTILPEITGSDSILQATFKHKTIHQWKGHLNKYALNSDGSIGSLQWNAGSVLAATAAADRQIWTVNTGLTNGLNNFVTGNIDYLRIPLLENSGTGYTDLELQALIDFVRGVDSYGEFSSGVDDEGDTIITGERWKLADIYHSRAVIVGAPSSPVDETADSKTESYYRYANGYNSFKTAQAARDTMVYVGSNGGMLHAFNSSDGTEEWAFIPPSIMPNFVDMISSSSGQSSAIYGVDGSPVVKDIYYGGSWHTVLIAGARQGGHTYFALDVTDPAAPEHLFTFTHNESNATVSYWAADGTRTDWSTTGTITAEYDFSELGEAWSAPLILRLPVGSGGAMTWTAVFGGGYNNGISPDYGAQLYVIDLEDGGKIIQNISIGDTVSGNGIQSSVPPTVLAVSPDSSTFFQGASDPQGAIIVFSDLEGKLWKVNLTDQGTLYETSKLFNAEATSTNTRYTFHQNAATLDSDGYLYQFYGTGDIQSLGDVDTNIANRAYGFKSYPVMTGFPTGAMSTVSDMVDTASGTCPTTSDDGWYFNLDAHEKVTAKATVYNSTVLFPRYTPDATSICSAGSAKITEHDYECGTLVRESDLGYGVPTEAIIYKNKIYMGISTDLTGSSLPTGFSKTGNLIVGDPANPSTGTIKVESWWESFFDF